MSKIAVSKTGGKQYLVIAGDNIKVEKLLADKGVEFKDVLLTSDQDGNNFEVGKPNLAVPISATISKQARAKKILVVHYKAKSRYHKKYGHRQPFTEVKIGEIA